MRFGFLGLLVTLAVIVFLSNAPSEPDMRSRLPEFQRLVDARRSATAGAEPIRIVVYNKDNTVFSLSNSFEQVIYDETDKIDHNPSGLTGFWPYPGSSTGIIDVGYGRKSIERISGHFYRVLIADP